MRGGLERAMGVQRACKGHAKGHARKSGISQEDAKS